MKILIFLTVVALFAITAGVFVPPRHHKKKIELLGADHCTWGPTHWCRNLTNAAECHATKHCIDSVWTHMTLPPDDSSVCQICLDMVKQARDQLESNETQELIKQVFEGTCALIHLKPIVEECDKIADNYIPDLIETLASEMNPQVVCSVAGLCNNDRVHQLLAEQTNTETTTTAPAKRDPCKDCNFVVGLAEERFNKLSRDEVLQNMLSFCGKMGSFSDGCSNIVVTYFQEIYSHIQDHFNPNEVCLMSGECSAKFHKHNTAKVEITPISHIGYVPVDTDKGKDDLPCELCEQLVGHLKELLIANTTEEEFNMVLQGLCKQTGKFSNECLSLVQQYYPQIYHYLVNELNSSEVCTMIGICPTTSTKETVIAPLLPAKTAKVALTLSKPEETPLVHIKVQSEKSTLLPPLLLPPGLIQEQQEPQQLPIDLLMPPHTQLMYNKEVCQFCQYFLHFVQIQITEPKTEEKIKQVLESACEKLPDSINATCTEFVETYEPALIALLAQEMDPSQICPLVKACPSSENKDVEIFMQAKGNSKCPLCLFAVTKLESMVKDKKTKESIENALDKLCLHLPDNMSEECEDFVKTYTDELVEMLIADLSPQEVCVYLKLCSDSRASGQLPPYVSNSLGGDVETNGIPDNTVNGKLVENNDRTTVEDGPQCVLCEFVMKEIEDQLQDKTTDKQIEHIVKDICNIMPSSVKKQCNDFVDQYADAVIQLLIETLKPNEICPMLKLCSNQAIQNIHVEILECPLCQLTVEAMEKILANPKIDHDVEHVLEKTCRGVPSQYRNKCVEIIEKYGDSMIDMLIHYTDKDFVCQKIGYCKSTLHEIIID